MRAEDDLESLLGLTFVQREEFRKIWHFLQQFCTFVYMNLTFQFQMRIFQGDNAKGKLRVHETLYCFFDSRVNETSSIQVDNGYPNRIPRHNKTPKTNEFSNIKKVKTDFHSTILWSVSYLASTVQGFSNVVVLEKSDRLGGRLEDVDLRKLAQPLYGKSTSGVIKSIQLQ